MDNPITQFDSDTSARRMDAVSDKLTTAILQIDPQEVYGSDGRDAVGAVLISRLATALVSIEKERREAARAQSIERQDSAPTRTIQYAPVIPIKATVA